MNALLYPAIALMNRLSLAMKFSLISLLFFVPLLATNFFIVRDAYTGLVETRTELDSLDLFRDTLKIRQGLDSYYDLVQINSILGQSGRAGTVDQRATELGQKLIAAIAALQPASSNPEQVTDFNERRDSLLADMRAVVAESGLQGKVGMAEKVLTKAVVFLKYVSSQSGISTDRDPGVRLVAELVTEMTPRISSVLGTGRAVGSFSLGQGFLDSGSGVRFDDLLLQLERTHGEYGLTIAEVLKESPEAEQRLGALVNASRETLNKGGELFEEQIVASDTLDMPWETFYETVSGMIAKTYQVDDAAVAFLREQLGQRAAADRMQMILLIAALLAVFVLIGYLYSGFYVATRGALDGLGKVMQKVAGGDMTVAYQARSADEIGQLGRTFNDSVAKIRTLIERVGQTVLEVEQQAGRVEGVSAESNQAVASQMGQIEQVATAMNEMSATAQEVARSAAAAVDSAQNVNRETINGRHLVESQVGSIERLAGEIDTSVAVINQLAADSASISQVLDVIKGIAEQTNLLALNAAIEAARAGEQGRGFAVVADEVRNLAKRTQQSTEEIEKMIAQLHGGVGAAVKAMSGSHAMASGTVSESAKVQLSLENILGAVGMIVDQSQQIATAAEEQTAVAQDIDQNLVQINRAGERTAAGAGQTEQASRELSRLVAQLKQLTGAFRV